MDSLPSHLAWPQPTPDAVAQGLRRVQKQTADEIALIDHARTVALEHMQTEIGADGEIAEWDLIDAVVLKARASKYLAAYVVDELRGMGSISKDWRTGIVRLAPAK